MSPNPTMTPAAKAFIGSWELESFTEQAEDSDIVHPLGENATGLLIYTEEGFVSAQLMKVGRKELSGNLWDVGHSAGLAELAAGYIAYSGRFAVNEETKQVIHTPIVALIPNLVCDPQLRTYCFEGTNLSLQTIRTEAGSVPVTTRLVWRRLGA